MIFENRADAGRKLAEKLSGYKTENSVIFALPRGGIPVGREIAKKLKSPLKILVVRKLGAPLNPEFAIGAIAPGKIRILDQETIDYLKISAEEIAEIEGKERQELKRRVKKYHSRNCLQNIKNKTVILVDDGIATGMTMKAAVTAVLVKNPKKLIITVPVCAREAAEELKNLADGFVCLSTPENFSAVGEWYQNFPQLTDEETMA